MIKMCEGRLIYGEVKIESATLSENILVEARLKVACELRMERHFKTKSVSNVSKVS